MSADSGVKAALTEAGFEVYRTTADNVHLAERVRDNLIMDSGVFVSADGTTVSFCTSACHRAFPQDDEGSIVFLG